VKYGLCSRKWLMIILVFWLCGCGKQQEVKEGIFWVSTGGRVCGEQGVFETESGRVYFSDIQSGTKSIICDSASCSHGRQECSAFFDGGTVYAALEEDHLLVVTGYGADRFGDYYLYETDVNGGNRRRLAFLRNMQTVDYVQFSGDEIVIAYHNFCDENLEPLETRIAGIYVYDRAEQQGKNVWSIEDYNANIADVYYQDETIFFIQVYRENNVVFHRELCSLDLKTGEMYVIEPYVDASASEIVLYQGKILYAYNGAIWQYDIKTQEKSLAIEQEFYLFGSYSTDWVLLRNDFQHAFYNEKDGVGNYIEMKDILCFKGFREVIYAYYCPEGASKFEVVYFCPEDILDGNTNAMRRFKE